MSKSKKGSKENPLGSDEPKGIIENRRQFEITQATIKDDFCNYSFEIIAGVGIGDTHNVKGKAGIIKDTMRTAFSKFNVHLAVIDDAFKNSGIEIEDIDMQHNHDLTLCYNVTGFTIKGGKDNESIVLSGNKYVSSAGGRMELESPKITIDNLGGYKWYNELATAAENAREEVALYKEGNYVPVKEDIEEPDPKQSKINFNVDAVIVNGDFSDFENAKV